MLKRFKTLSMLTLVFVVVAPFVTLQHLSKVEASGITCQEYTTEVKLSALSLFTYTLAGELCYEGTLTGKPLQVLVAGASYNRYYWHLETSIGDYSYRNHAIEEGFATFSVDRLGTGASDRPLGLLMNLNTEAYTLKQLLQRLGNGSLTGHSFDNIILVGHSLGSLVSISLASQHYGLVDAVVLTGFAHNQSLDGQPQGLLAYYPAILDPKFFGNLSYTDYLTSVPGSRGGLFYSNLASSQVIAEDEVQKDVVASIALVELLQVFSTASQNINVPVLLAVGSEDLLFCGLLVDCSSEASVYAHESQYFSQAAQLEVAVFEGVGHNIALHDNFETTSQVITDWINSL